MKRTLSALAILATLASPARSEPPSFWLVDIVPGAVPAVRVVDDFELPGACFKASLDHKLTDGAAFATCIGLDEAGEEAMGAYVAFEYGLIDGDY